MRTCTKCKGEKSIDDFSRKGVGHQPWCKQCSSERSKQYYADNTNKHREVTKLRNRAQRQLLREYVNEYLLQHPCVDCGNTDLRVLDFDHVRGQKELGISQMVGWGLGLDHVIAEIEKCEVRCANCHRIVTHERRKSLKETSK